MNTKERISGLEDNIEEIDISLKQSDKSRKQIQNKTQNPSTEHQ